MTLVVFHSEISWVHQHLVYPCFLCQCLGSCNSNENVYIGLICHEIEYHMTNLVLLVSFFSMEAVQYPLGLARWEGECPWGVSHSPGLLPQTVQWSNG